MAKKKAIEARGKQRLSSIFESIIGAEFETEMKRYYMTLVKLDIMGEYVYLGNG